MFVLCAIRFHARKSSFYSQRLFIYLCHFHMYYLDQYQISKVSGSSFPSIAKIRSKSRSKRNRTAPFNSFLVSPSCLVILRIRQYVSVFFRHQAETCCLLYYLLHIPSSCFVFSLVLSQFSVFRSFHVTSLLILSLILPLTLI